MSRLSRTAATVARIGIAATFSFCALVSCGGSVAFGQNAAGYDDLSSLKEPAGLRIDFPTMLRKGDSNANLMTECVKYQAAEFTLEKNFKNLHALRRKIKLNLGEASRAPKTDAHDQYNQLLFREMLAIARGNHHPFARANAMLIIADLNQVEFLAGTSKPAVPLAATLPVLLDELASPDQLDVVRMFALRGILHHAESGIIDEGLRTRVLQTATTIAESPDPPVGRHATAQAWARARSVDILAALGTPSVTPNDNQVANAFAGMVAETESPRWMRLAAAQGFGSLDFTNDKQVASADAARSIGELWVAVYEYESNQVAQGGPMGAMFPGGMMGGPGGMPGGAGAPGGLGMGGLGMGGAGGMAGAPDMGAMMPGGRGGRDKNKQKPAIVKDDEKEKPDPMLWALRHTLICLQTGLEGQSDLTTGERGLVKAAAASADDKKFVDDLAARLTECEKILVDKKLEREARLTQLADKMNDIKEWLEETAPAEADPTPVNEDPATATAAAN